MTPEIPARHEITRGSAARSAAGTVTMGALRPEHVRPLTSLHRAAFPDFFMSQLGKPFLRQFYAGFLTDPTGVAVVAERRDGRPMGVAVGSVDPNGFFSRLLRRRLIGFALASIYAVFRHPRALRRLVRALRYRGNAHPATRGALLSSICVDPNAGGHGLGTLLITAWERRAAELGADAAYLTTDATNNDAANAFYVSRGWSHAGTITTPEGRLLNAYTKKLT